MTRIPRGLCPAEQRNGLRKLGALVSREGQRCREKGAKLGSRADRLSVAPRWRSRNPLERKHHLEAHHRQADTYRCRDEQKHQRKDVADRVRLPPNPNVWANQRCDARAQAPNPRSDQRRCGQMFASI